MAEPHSTSTGKVVQDAAQVHGVSSTLIHERGWSKLKSLDGKSRAYTVSVLSTLALGIALLYFDVGFLETEKNDEVVLEKATAVNTFSAAGRQIFRALLLLVLCVFIAVNAFFMIGINVYPFKAEQRDRHVRWLVFAFIACITTNALVITVLVTAQIKYRGRRDDETNRLNGFPHYFLTASLIASTVAMDLLFIFAFLRSQEDLDQKHASGWARMQNRLRSIVRLGQTNEGNQTPSPPSLLKRIRTRCGEILNKFMVCVLERITAFVQLVYRTLGLGKREEEEESSSICRATVNWTKDVSEVFLGYTKFVQSSWLFQMAYRLLAFLTWGMWKAMRNTIQGSTQKSKKVIRDDESDDANWRDRLWAKTLNFIDDWVLFWQKLGERVRCHIDTMYEDIREEDQFQHSAWVLAAMGTSFVLLVYFGVGLSAYVSNYLDDTYIPRRDCAVTSLERNGQLGDFMFRLAGFTETSRELGTAGNVMDDVILTELACNVDLTDLSAQVSATGQDIRQSQAEVEQQISVAQSQASQAFLGVNGTTLADANPENVAIAAAESRLYRCSTMDFSENSCLPLAIINRLENDTAAELNESKRPTEVFKEHGIGQVIYVFDRILRHLVWAIWVGLMCGLAIGMYSLLSVLKQYKRFSLAIRSGFFSDLPMSENLAILDDEGKNLERFQSIVVERQWTQLIQLYPMGASVFFFGILVSTAVLQLVVFGGAVSFLLAFIASVFDDRVFAILRPYLALLIAFLITWLLNGPIAQRVLAEGILVRRYRVYHELCFLLFLLVYTTVHLVLGVFFALIRLLWVLLTTIASLNRLDQNLFPLLKGNDLGHKSFMSMVLMQHAFLSNADTGVLRPFTEILSKIRDRRNRGNDEPSSSQPSDPTTSPESQAATASPNSARMKQTQDGERKRTVSFILKEDLESDDTAMYLPEIPEADDDLSSVPSNPSHRQTTSEVTNTGANNPQTDTATAHARSSTSSTAHGHSQLSGDLPHYLADN